MYEKLEKLIERVLANLHSSNLVNTILVSLLSILTLQFINYVKFNFGKSYLPSDTHTNTVISSALPTRQDGAENRDKAYCSSRH